MNGLYLSSTGFKSIRVGLTLHGSSFKDRNFVWLCAEELLKFNNKHLLNKAEDYFILFVFIKYL